MKRFITVLLTTFNEKEEVVLERGIDSFNKKIIQTAILSKEEYKID